MQCLRAPAPLRSYQCGVTWPLAVPSGRRAVPTLYGDFPEDKPPRKTFSLKPLLMFSPLKETFCPRERTSQPVTSEPKKGEKGPTCGVGREALGGLRAQPGEERPAEEAVAEGMGAQQGAGLNPGVL